MKQKNQVVALRKFQRAKAIAGRCISVDAPLPKWVMHQLTKGR